MTLKTLLDEKVEAFNTSDFIAEDPISLPHRFTKLQDIEIIGFWVATLAWGRRSQIIKSGERLLELMDNSPHDFILNHQEIDRKPFSTLNIVPFSRMIRSIFWNGCSNITKPMIV